VGQDIPAPTMFECGAEIPPPLGRVFDAIEKDHSAATYCTIGSSTQAAAKERMYFRFRLPLKQYNGTISNS
jgi:hypothetical protein